jgi:hypothetical protein
MLCTGPLFLLVYTLSSRVRVSRKLHQLDSLNASLTSQPMHRRHCNAAAPGTIVGLDPMTGASSEPGTMSLQTTQQALPRPPPPTLQSLFSIAAPLPTIPEVLSAHYIIASTGATFMFNNYNYTAREAEEECQRQGGHLASYDTVQEQLDVEAFLISNVGARCSCLFDSVVGMVFGSCPRACISFKSACQVLSVNVITASPACECAAESHYGPLIVPLLMVSAKLHVCSQVHTVGPAGRCFQSMIG